MEFGPGIALNKELLFTKDYVKNQGKFLYFWCVQEDCSKRNDKATT